MSNTPISQPFNPLFSPQFSESAHRLLGANEDLWQVHSDALNRLTDGEDIIVMSVGDPDLDTIDPIIEHAVTSLYRGRTHYSPSMGELSLRKKIANIETRSSGKTTSPDEVIVFPGATNAIFTVLSCLLNPLDELIVTEPTYVGYEGIFDTVGCKVIRVPTKADQGFALDLQAIASSITSATKALLLNTPGNPSGHVIDEADLRQLAEMAVEKNLWLICDEVYSMLAFEKQHVSARRAATNLDNVIIIDGLSKSHAMTGWRLGWVVAPPSAIEPLLSFTSATVFGCSQFIQDAATFALENDAQYIASIKQEYRDRRDYSLERIRALTGITCQRPDAGMFLMIDVSAVAPDGGTFARRLLDDVGVSVLPGIGFGSQTRHHVRLSLTHETEVLKRAFDRIELFLIA